VAHQAIEDAQAINREYNEIKRSSVEIGKRLFRQREALKGKFKTWCIVECRFNRSHVYRFINFYEMSLEYDLTGKQISTTALMKLAAPKVSEELRGRIIEQAATTRVTVADVEQAIADAGERRENTVASLLIDASPSVVFIVGKYGVDSPGTIRALKRLAKNPNSATIEEIIASGYIQPGEGEDAVHITASSADVERAIGAKATAHRKNGNDERTHALVRIKGRVTVDSSGEFHIEPTHATKFPDDITGKNAHVILRVFK
jgi:hypothetical protein